MVPSPSMESQKPDRSMVDFEFQRIGELGRGALTITDYELNNVITGETAGFAWIQFRVELFWRSEDGIEEGVAGTSCLRRH